MKRFGIEKGFVSLTVTVLGLLMKCFSMERGFVSCIRDCCICLQCEYSELCIKSEKSQIRLSKSLCIKLLLLNLSVQGI